MTLEQDIAAWVAERPDRQKDAVARFCRHESLSADDISSIADELIARTYPSATAITARDVPGASESGDPVTLGGYARLIREAVTARIKADLLGDVFAKDHDAQSATFEYQNGDERATWKLGDPSTPDFSSIRFYDEECGEAHVTSASEISYRPSALTLLDRLSRACDDIQQEVSRRLAENAQQRPELPHRREGSQGVRQLAQRRRPRWRSWPPTGTRSGLMSIAWPERSMHIVSRGVAPR